MNRNSIDERTAQSIEEAELTGYRKLIAGLPLTLRPSLNGQLAEWSTLFPYERKRIRHFLLGLSSMDPAALATLMQPLLRLEARMGVAQWSFSESSDTMENASLLARSEFYAEWRDQIRRIYGAVEAAAQQHDQPLSPQPRLVVAILPASLPFDPGTVWNGWEKGGSALSIDGDPARISELLLQGPSSIPALLTAQADFDDSDLWLIDAESRLQSLHSDAQPAASLSWTSLLPLRDHVLERVNTVPRSIEVTDQTLAAIRSENMSAWWPSEIKDEPRLQRFLIDLYLSGNGALIFSNAFVQWAANEALRRARPRVLITRFGMRARPKPFTGIAIFENQHRISALPDADDPIGSAIDASVLARYVRFGAQRYPEGDQTAFLAIAESAKSAYLVAPPASQPIPQLPGAVTPERLAAWIRSFTAGQVQS